MKPTPITTIGIITADRPASLARALESAARHCRRFGRRPRLLVIDGSRSRSNGRANADAVRTLGQSGEIVEYVGPLQAARLRRTLRLTDRGPFKVGVGTVGANRTLFLLLTAGEHVLSVDDDVVCDVWTPKGAGRAMAVTGHEYEYFETAFFDSRRAALVAAGRADLDLVAAHEDLLGRQLSALISPEADLTHACRFVRASLERGRPLTVRATFAGTAGDAGTHCPYHLLGSKGELRSLLWASRLTFARAMRSREAARAATRPVVTHNSACMGACLALANTGVLPPFMPVGRGEDTVFGLMLGVSDPCALFGHVPAGVVHDSHRRSRRPARMISATETRLSDVLMTEVPALVPARGTLSPVARLRKLGRALAEIGGLSWQDLAVRVRTVTAEGRARDWQRVEESLADPACPQHWRTAAAQYRAKYEQSAKHPDFFLPIEFRDRGSIAGGHRALGRCLVRFGELIEAWPEIWERARSLNDRHGRGQGRLR